MRESFEAKGLGPVLWAQGPVFAFAYFPVPAAGHYVEHIQCFGDGGAFLASVGEPEYCGGVGPACDRDAYAPSLNQVV